MVGKFERRKDVIQELTESGANHIGNIVSIIAGTVRDVARETEHGAHRVGNIATLITDTVKDVTHEIGDWISDGIEMREAAKAAREDRNPHED